ncbi:MAG: hypothetical protein WAN46_06110, partial [Gammaproteobacteria bacterium]
VKGLGIVDTRMGKPRVYGGQCSKPVSQEGADSISKDVGSAAAVGYVVAAQFCGKDVLLRIGGYKIKEKPLWQELSTRIASKLVKDVCLVTPSTVERLQIVIKTEIQSSACATNRQLWCRFRHKAALFFFSGREINIVAVGAPYSETRGNDPIASE